MVQARYSIGIEEVFFNNCIKKQNYNNSVVQIRERFSFFRYTAPRAERMNIYQHMN